MTTEQIYINGVLMEQSSGKVASLVFQSPFFTDIDSIVSNRTNSVDFPTTESNLRAIENAQLPGSGSKYAYRKHKVQYFRDGVQIFSGFGTLLSVTPTSIKFSFTWGNVNAFKQLLDIKLRDLQYPGAYVDWTVANIQTNINFPTNVEWTAQGRVNGYLKTAGHTHPMLRVTDILSRLETVSGVTIENKNIFENLAIPMMSKNADETSKRMSSLLISNGSIYDNRDQSWIYPPHRLCLCPSSQDRDLFHFYLGDGLYDVENVNEIHMRVQSGVRLLVTGLPSGTSLWRTPGIAVYAYDEDGNHGLLLEQFTFEKSGSFYILKNDIDRVINVESYTHIAFVLVDAPSSANSISCDIFGGMLSFSVVCDENDATDVPFGGKFPLFYNLPDWSASQLLKNVMKLYGLFPVCCGSKTIRFVSITDFYLNRKNAPDWTEKLILTNGIANELTPTFGSFAQRSMFKYAEDDTVKQSANAAMLIDNENLDTESDLISVDFAATETDDKGVLRFRAYAVEGDDAQNYEQFTELSPRVFRLDGRAAEFESLKWSNLLSEKYGFYQQVVNHPKLLKASVILDALELQQLDLSVPIYSFALGHYYAINKLTTKDNGIADVELLQLGSAEVIEDELDNKETFESLTVLPDADGNYYTRISSLTDERNREIALDESYKICILRYGYSRRGKHFKYKDSYGWDIWSHSSRVNKKYGVPHYTDLRKGLQYRIIGAEILERGGVKAWSQQSRTGFYDEATLVCPLGATLTLPHMRSLSKRGSRVMSSHGRITNRAKDGLAELYIALYRKNAERKWIRVSNIVQVRGRNADKTRLWEFEKERFVSIG